MLNDDLISKATHISGAELKKSLGITSRSAFYRTLHMSGLWEKRVKIPGMRAMWRREDLLAWREKNL